MVEEMKDILLSAASIFMALAALLYVTNDIKLALLSLFIWLIFFIAAVVVELKEHGTKGDS
jgi:hypothetical protein